MADAPSAPEASNPIYIVIAIIIGLFIVWLYTGGPTRYEAEHPEVPLPTAAEIGVPITNLPPTQ